MSSKKTQARGVQGGIQLQIMDYGLESFFFIAKRAVYSIVIAPVFTLIVLAPFQFLDSLESRKSYVHSLNTVLVFLDASPNHEDRVRITEGDLAIIVGKLLIFYNVLIVILQSIIRLIFKKEKAQKEIQRSHKKRTKTYVLIGFFCMYAFVALLLYTLTQEAGAIIASLMLSLVHLLFVFLAFSLHGMHTRYRGAKDDYK